MAKNNKFLLSIFLILLSAVILSSCGVNPPPTSETPTLPPDENGGGVDEPVEVPDPKSARDTALGYIRDHFEDKAPAEGAVWLEQNITPEDLIGATTLRYSSDDWTVTISFPIVAPEATIYATVISNQSLGFHWEGVVDARGQVVQTSVSTEEKPTEQPPQGWATYFNENHLYTVQYPDQCEIVAESTGFAVTFSGPVVAGLPQGDDHWPMITVRHYDSDFYKPPAGTDLDQWITDAGFQYDMREMVTSVDGLTTVHHKVYATPQSYAYDEYFFIRGEQLFSIRLVHSGGKEDWDVYNTFLGTFAFDADDGDQDQVIVIPEDALPVVAWVGHVASLPAGSQFDDFVILMPEGAGETGIEGTTPEIRAQIEVLRDAAGVEEHITLWGGLVCPAVDYNGCQLLVTDLKYGQFIAGPEFVKDWQGELVCSHFNSAPTGPCGTAFVLDGDFPVWYGVWSRDAEILSQLEGLRDSGAKVRLWGNLVAGVPDVNGTQIRVTRYKVVGALPEPAPTPTPTPAPTPTPVPTPCNAAKFVKDVSVNDGTPFTPGSKYTKIWRLKNVGTCTWTPDYDLIYVSGDRMGGQGVIAVPANVPPGNTIDLSVALVAPGKPGKYRGYWMLRDGNKHKFGLGDEADKAFWVDIEVYKPNQDFSYDFALNYCQAAWASETGDLPCPGSTSSQDGFVRLLREAALENRYEDEPLLWMHPNEERYGWIEGEYPLYKVKDGDHFKAWVGCFEGDRNCNLTFRLDYETANGRFGNLGEWHEVYEGKVTKIDLDLSNLVRKSVKFILRVTVNNRQYGDANAFWFVPRIENEIEYGSSSSNGDVSSSENRE